jgi:DNA-binding response OmpR family regulator
MLIARGYWAAATGSAPSRLFHRSITSLQRRRRRAAGRLEPVASLPDSADTLHAGELEIRLGDGLVLAGGRALMLSVREFELLVAMARKIGAIVTREELFGTVWGSELRPGDRSVDVYVSKLRGKLETAMPDRRFIHTHPGFGYRFQPEASTEPGLRTPAGKIGPATESAAEPDRLSRDVHTGTPRT